MLEQTEYTPDELFISAPVTARATIKTGVSFPARTPLMVDATEPVTLMEWSGKPDKA
ncbi:head-DNA stabilization protein, partial [Bradyrhizobium canariense]